jgi:hypothetical protein
MVRCVCIVKSQNITEIILPETIEQRIFLSRAHKIMLDVDLAQMYGVVMNPLGQPRKSIGFQPES